MRPHRDHHGSHLRQRRCLPVPVLDHDGRRLSGTVAGSVHRDRSYRGTDRSRLRADDLLRRGGRARGARARRGGRAGAVALGLAAGSHVGSASPWAPPGITRRTSPRSDPDQVHEHAPVLQACWQRQAAVQQHAAPVHLTGRRVPVLGLRVKGRKTQPRRPHAERTRPPPR
jgi:hypothetical protein